MKKVLKLNKTLIVLGIIILISLISFLGLYSKENGVWKNILKEYNLGMELEGYRQLRFSLDTSEEEKEIYVDDNGNILGFVEDGTDSQDTSIPLTEETQTEANVENKSEAEYKTEKRTIKSNEDSVITIENFELSKDVIQKRMNSLNGIEYNIRVDNVTGELVLEVPDGDNISTVQALVSSKGSFDIIDYQTGIVLLDNKDLSNVKAIANSEENGYQLYLQISLNENGKKKISEISKKYVQTTDENGENTTKYVSVRFEGQALLSTYFGEEIKNGVLTVPVGNPTQDNTEFSTLGEQANRIAYILNEKELPIKYTLVSDDYIKSEITEEIVFIAKIILALSILITSAILVVKYKLKGLVLSIVSIGYLAITALLLRYANVPLTLNSMYTLVVCIILNYIFVIKLLEKLKNINLKTAFVQTMKEYYLLIVPVIAFSIVFTIVSPVSVSSIGMTLFWGLLTGVIYNSFVIFVLKLV